MANITDEKTKSYVRMIEAFAIGKLDADGFERLYLDTFKNEQTELPGRIFEILDRLFGDVDAYCADAEIRTGEELDAEQLRKCAVRALSELRNNASTT